MNSFWDVMAAIGSLLIIILVIVATYYASRWYARRMGATTSSRYVNIVDRANLGSTSSLLIVQVAGKHYLVGLSDKNMQMLAELEDFQRYLDENPAQEPAQNPFGQMLRGLMDKKGQSAKRDDGGEE